MRNQFFKPANYHSTSSVDPRDFTERTLFEPPDDSLWRDELRDWFDTTFCRQQGRVEAKHAHYEHGDD